MVSLKDFLDKRGFATKLGAKAFEFSDITEKQKDPQYEMEKAQEMYNNIPMVKTGIDQFVRFTISNITIQSKDKMTSLFFNKWLEQRKEIKNELKEFATCAHAYGNGYFEQAFKELSKGGIVLDNLAAINDPSRVYYNTNAQNLNEYWLYQIPNTVTHIMRKGKKYTATFYRINYTYGSRFINKTIWAIPLHKDEIVHFKRGLSKDGFYGKSALMSSIDDGEVVREIVKNYAIKARYKAIGKKIISIGDENDPAGPDDIDQLESDLFNLEKREHIISNKKITTNDLLTTDGDDSMSQQLDYLRKDISTGLVPNFMTPWANPNSAGTSEKANIPFELELKEYQRDLIDFLNQIIIKPILAVYPKLSDDATFNLGKIDLESIVDKINYGLSLYNSNIISMNEFRILAGYDSIDGGDKFLKDISPNTQNFSFSYNNDKSVKESISDEDEKWSKDIKNIGYSKYGLKIIRRADIKGRIIRLVEDENYYNLFDGKTLINQFELDFKNVANQMFEDYKKLKIKALDEFFDEETPEDKLEDKTFDDIKKLNAQIIQDVFKLLPQNKKKFTEKFTLDTDILDKLGGIFDKFSDNISQIVNNATQKLLGITVDPSIGFNDIGIVDKEIEDELKQKSDIIKGRIEQQLKTFNDKAKNDIYRIISDGIASNRSISDIQQEIKDKYAGFKTKKNPQDFDISRIVRTELANASSLFNILKWKAQGFEYVEWLTRNDDKVRPAHREMNRKIISIDDILNGKEPRPGNWTKNGVQSAGESINCRCRLVPYS